MSNKNRHPTRAPRREKSVSQSSEAPSEPNYRGARLEHLVLDELHSLFAHEASDPQLTRIVPLAVHLSLDGGHARVAYAVRAAIDQEAQARAESRAALLRATGFVRTRLASQLNLKRAPQISFTFVGITEGSGE